MKKRTIIRLVGHLLEAGHEDVESGPEMTVRYWNLDPTHWRVPDNPTPLPEAEHLPPPRVQTLGVAFSGGGTRSASATLGQLRGLSENQWIPRIRYMAAVSGGAWAATPFTFTETGLGIFLGDALEPSQITRIEDLRNTGGVQCLAETIAESTITLPALRAALPSIVDRVVDDIAGKNQDFGNLLEKVVEELGPDKDLSEVFSNIIGRIFVDPHVPHASSRFFTWNEDTRQQALERNQHLKRSDFVIVPNGRPFLIVGGTMIEHRPEVFSFPNLIPIEYTPYYTGVRQGQKFGENFGGHYVWSCGYDTHQAQLDSDGLVKVRARSTKKRFTLHDVVGSSGAAPQLFFYVNKKIPAQIREVPRQVFPEFDHWTVRDGKVKGHNESIPHGDGGFSDNLGLMPLLVRKVTRLIVFVNAKSPFRENDDLRSYFGQTTRHDRSGDFRINRVFGRGLDEAKQLYDKMIESFEACVANGTTVMHCGMGYSIVGNDRYNIAPYDDVNICWIYNHPVKAWVDAISNSDLRNLIPLTTAAGTLEEKEGLFAHFPWYDTFGEAKPRAIDLKAEQVSLLAHLSYWNVTNPASRDTILGVIGDAL